MKKYIAITAVFSVVLFGFLNVTAPVSAQTVPVTVGSDTSEDAPSAVPVTSTSNSDSSTTSGLPSSVGSNQDANTAGALPTTVGNNGSGDPAGLPTTVGSNQDSNISGALPTVVGTNSNGDPSGLPTTVGSNSNSTNTNSTTTATTTPPTGLTNNGSVSFSGGGATFSAAVSATPATTTASAATTTDVTTALSCPFMTGYVIPGQSNNPSDITKLQVFLSTYEHDSTVKVTGVLDQATTAGVIAFQNAHLSSIMGPWGVVTPSGQVYITTLKQINNIVCSAPLSLSPSEIAVINAYKADITGGAIGIGTNASSTTNVNANVNAPSTTGNVSGQIGSSTNASSTGNNSLLTGNVVSSGAGSFFANLFGKILSFFGVK